MHVAGDLHLIATAAARGRFAGLRRGDLVTLTREARQEGRIRLTSRKRRVPVDVPEDPRLTAWLALIPDKPQTSPRQGRKLAKGLLPGPSRYLVLNLAGRPYTEDGLGQELAKLIGRLAAAEAIDSARYDLHGLRHTHGVELALAGCTDAEGAAMMGHSSPNSFAQYRREADRLNMVAEADRKVAAMREQAANDLVENQEGKKWKTPGRLEHRPLGQAPDRSGESDGTTSQVRTEDLQSHNLAL